MEHASNILYRGECSSFEEAMRLVQQQCTEEERQSMKYRYPGDEEEYEKLRKILRAMSLAAAQCLVEHKLMLEKLAEKWAASDDEDVRMIGEAVQSGDYSSLAI